MDESVANDNSLPPFLEETLPTRDPIALFLQWQRWGHSKYPSIFYAASLATCSKQGWPSNRMVALEYASVEDGFVISTLRGTRKTQDLTENPRAALCFWWHPRMIRVEGIAEEMSKEKTSAVYNNKPDNFRRVLNFYNGPNTEGNVCQEGRLGLDKAYVELSPPQPGECPEHIVSYSIKPLTIEFYQSDGKLDKPSDKLKFRKPGPDEKPDGKVLHSADDGWVFERVF